jgi:hypothetical protein
VYSPFTPQARSEHRAGRVKGRGSQGTHAHTLTPPAAPSHSEHAQRTLRNSAKSSSPLLSLSYFLKSISASFFSSAVSCMRFFSAAPEATSEATEAAIPAAIVSALVSALSMSSLIFWNIEARFMNSSLSTPPEPSVSAARNAPLSSASLKLGAMISRACLNSSKLRQLSPSSLKSEN